MMAMMQHNGIAPEVVDSCRPALPEPPPDCPVLGSPRRTGASSAPALSSTPAPPSATSAPSSTSATAYGSLLPLGSATQDLRPESITGMSAESVYLDFMYYGDVPSGLRPNEKTRVRKIARFFNAFATDAEKSQLRNRQTEAGVSRQIAKDLHACVRARLQQVFQGAGMNVAKDKPSCADGQRLSSSAVETLIYDAEKAEKDSMTHDILAYAKLRATLEGAGASTSGAAAAGGKHVLEEGEEGAVESPTAAKFRKMARGTVSGLWSAFGGS